MTDKEYISTKNAFMLSIVAVALSLGLPVGELTYNELFTHELQDYFYCTADAGEKNAGQTFEFNSLSRSEHRGYPYEGTTKGYKDCGDDDIWVGVLEYSKILGIDPYELISTEEPETQTEKLKTTSRAKKELCNVDGTCVDIL